MKKKIFSYLFITIISLITFCGVKAAPSSIHVNGPHELQTSNVFGGVSHTIIPKLIRNENDKPVYCADASKNFGEGDWSKSNEITSNALIYICENGYGGSNNYASQQRNADYDYLITQAALWHFVDNNGCIGLNAESCSGSGTISSVIDSWKSGNTNGTTLGRLITDASNANYNTSTGSLTLKLTVASNNLTLTSDGNYYISNEISLTSINSNATVDAGIKVQIKNDSADGAFLTTDSSATTGSANITVNSGKVYVKIPANKMSSTDKITITATVTGKQNISTTKVYEYTNSGWQSLIYCDIGTSQTPLSDTKEKTFSISSKTVKISKTDITGSKEIPGATIEVKKGNELVTAFTSVETPKELQLDPGTYTLTETIAPYGYIMSSETIEFTVNDDGSVTVNGKTEDKVIMKNEPILVHISKRSINGRNELPGAKLKITKKDDGTIAKDLDGNSLEWESTSKEKTFHLGKGTYILTETTAPKGYELSETTLEFSVTDEGKVFVDKKEQKDNLIIFRNTPEAENVQTGAAYVFIIIGICIVALGVAVYFVVRKKNK